MKTHKLLLSALTGLFMITGCAKQAPPEPTAAPEATVTAVPEPEHSYHLVKVTALSRHNLRSPLSQGDTGIDMASPYAWYAWTSAPGELSVKGEQLETAMGEYFRQWLESEGMTLSEENTRFYANAMQRTLKTTECFAKALMDRTDFSIEQRAEYGTMDPVYMPSLHYYSDSYAEAVQEEFQTMKQEAGYQHLQQNYDLLAEVTGYEESPGYLSGMLTAMNADDTELVLMPDNPPALTGSLVIGTRLSDAVTLMYTEEADDTKATFGKVLSTEQYEQIAAVKEIYNDILYGLPLSALSIASPLVSELHNAFPDDTKSFTFFCGHDCNLASVITSLRAEEYALPDTLEKHAPIGGILLLTEWQDETGARYADIEMVYQSTKQLRDLTPLSLQDPPQRYRLSLQDLERTENGYYRYEDVCTRLEETLRAAEELKDTYK